MATSPNASDVSASPAGGGPRMSAPALDYAVQRRYRRRWIFRIATVLVLLSVSVTVYHFRQPIWSRVLRSYWTWRCMNHVTPADTALLEWDLPKVATLLKTHPDYVAPPYRRPVVVAVGTGAIQLPGGQASAEYVPRALRELYQFTPAATGVSLPNLTTGVVFLGQRRSASGNTRLVVIYGSIQNALTLDNAATIPHEVYIPASFFGGPPAAPVSSYNSAVQAAQFQNALLSPGVPDPDDAAHLTIDFSITSLPSGKPWPRGTIDVYLQNDDTLKFRVRAPPQTQSP